MRESQIEKHFVKRVKELGGKAEKFKSPGHRNVPDRLVTFPKKVLVFVELKATGEKPNDAQLRDHAERIFKGFEVYVVSSISQADTLAAYLYRASR